MADFIRKYDNLKLYSADISLKNGLLERHLWVPNTVLQNYKMKKPLLKGLFQGRDSSISMNGTPLGRRYVRVCLDCDSSISKKRVSIPQAKAFRSLANT